MSQQSIYEAWKTAVLVANKVIGDGQCVSLVVNNPEAYVEALFPGKNWETLLPPVAEAKQLFGDSHAQYFTTITNDHADPNQVPEQGDIMIFDATPSEGYENTYVNPDGHCGVCDSADANGYNLFQQNAPNTGSLPNVTRYVWKFRPCLCWLRPVLPGAPIQATPVAATPATVSVRVNGTMDSRWNIRTSPEIANNIRTDGYAVGGQEYAATLVEGWAQISFKGTPGYLGPGAFTQL